MSIRFNMLANSYGFRDIYRPQRQMVDVLYRNKDYFAEPDYERRYLRSKSDYEAVLSLARDTYLGEEDPTSYENRIALGKIISSLYPEVDPKYAADNIEDLMYYATGYRPNVDSLTENVLNTLHSAGSSILASYKMAGLYLGGALTGGFDNESFQAKKAEAMADLKRYAKDYRSDLADYSNPISKMVSPLAIGAAQILPSMLPSLGIAGAMSLASMIPGLNLAIPATTLSIIRGLRSGTILGRQAIMGGVSIGGRWAATAMMEMGGSAIEMAEAGFDDDIIFGTTLLIGAVNGVFETVGDKALDIALKPIRGALNGLSKEQTSKVLHKTVRSMIRDWRNDTISSVATESATETAQEFASMFGYNFAVALQEERGPLPPGVRKYTREDFGEAFKETIKQTALGTLGLSFGAGTLRMVSQVARRNSEFRRILEYNKFTTTEGMNARINASDITGTSGIDISGITQENFTKQAPIKVVRIGDKFRAVDATPEQAYAVQNGKYLNAEIVDMSTEKAIGHDINEEAYATHRGMTLDSINNAINAGLDNGAVEGFTYYDSDMSPVAPNGDVAYVSIKSSDISNPTVIPVTESDSRSAAEFEADIFGQTFTKVRDKGETAKKPSSSSASAETQADTAVDNEEITTPKTTEGDDQTLTDADLGINTRTAEDLESDDAQQGYADADSIVDDLIGDLDREEDTIIDDDIAPETIVDTEPIQQAEPNTEVNAEANTEADTITEEMRPAEQTVQQTTTEEQARINKADEDTSRVREESEARNKARNDWEDIKQRLTGNKRNDMDVLANHFRETLKNTDIGKDEKVLDAMSKASAAVMVGFAKASRLTGKDYYDTIRGFMYGVTSPDGRPFFQSAYHGSVADFDRFSTDHIGEGEGSQAFGWGLYFSKIQDVARGYAINNDYIDIPVLDRIIEKFNINTNFVYDHYYLFINNDINQVRSTIDERITELEKALNDIEANFSSMDDEHQYTISGIGHDLSKSEISDIANRLPQDIENYHKIADGLRNLTQSEWDRMNNQLTRNLYTVDIPDGPYIKWYEPIPQDIADIINRDNVVLITNDGVQYETNRTFGDFYKVVSWNITNNSQIRGDKYLSNLLHRNGYTGIVYPIGTLRGGYDPNATDMNYVVFNDDDVKITDHIYFQETQEGSYRGWFNPDELDRYISIMNNAEPTTLIHELGHHFLSVITPDNPIYGIVANVYAKQMAKDGGIFGEAVQEAFAKDLEKYVFLRKSSNRELNSIFQALYDVARSLWSLFKSSMRLSADKVQMFDAIFSDADTDADTAATIRIDSKADKSPTPMITMMEEGVRESAEPTPVDNVIGEMTEQVDNLQGVIDNAEADIGIDTLSVEDTTEPIVAGEYEKVVAVPQTQEEMELREKTTEYTVPDVGESFSIGDILNETLDEENMQPILSRMEDGKIDSRKIAAQIKKISRGNTDKRLEYVNKLDVTGKKVIKMETRSKVYKYISGLTGTDFDANAAEFYYAEDGSIIVNLKKDIRIKDGKTFLLDKTVPRWFVIPFYSNDNSVYTISSMVTQDLYASNLWNENVSSSINSKDIAEFRVKSGFNGWNSQELVAMIFAEVYSNATEQYDLNGENLSGYGKILFSIDDTNMRKNLSTYARNAVAEMNSSTLFGTFRKFNAELAKINKQANEAMKKTKPDATDAELDWNRRQLFNAVFPNWDIEGSTESQFGAYLESMQNDLGLSQDIIPLDADQRRIFFDELGNTMRIAATSYTSLAHTLKDGIKNEKKLASSQRLLKDMIRAAFNGQKTGKGTRSALDQITSLLPNNAKARFKNVWMAFRNDNNTDSATFEDFEIVINSLVNDDYSIANIRYDSGNQAYISPLIILANYYSNPGRTDKQENSFDFASRDYVAISQEILENQQDLSSADDIRGDVRSALRNLRNLLRKVSADKSLSALFNKATSFDYVNGLVQAIQDKIDEYTRNAESKKVTPELQEYIDKLTMDNDSLRSALDELKKTSEESSGNVDIMRKQISDLSARNKSLNDIFESIGGADNLQDISNYINQLERKIEKLDAKIKGLQENGTHIANYWKRKVEMMQNLPVYMTAKELQEKHKAIYDSIDMSIRDGRNDARVSAQLALIVNALKGKRGSAISDTLFESSFQDYDGWFDGLRQFAEKNGMIVDGKLQKRLQSLTDSDLTKFAEILNQIAERGQQEREYRNSKIKEMWDNILVAATKDVMLKGKTGEVSDAEFKEKLGRIRSAISDAAPGTVGVGFIKNLMSQFNIPEVELRTMSPVLHDLIFEGHVGGYNVGSINQADNSKIENTNRRKGKVSKLYADIYGNKAENFGLEYHRMFVQPKSKLGTMSVEDYEAKHGSLGTLNKRGNGFSVAMNDDLSDSIKPIARMVMRIRKAQKLNSMSENPDPAVDSWADEVLSRSNTGDFSIERMMGIYLLARQDMGLLRLITDPNNPGMTNHLSLGNVLWVMDQFESNKEFAKHKRFADGLAEIVGERYQEIADVFYRQRNRILPKEYNYYPIHDNSADTVSMLQQNGGLTRDGSISNSFVKNRTGGLAAADLDAILVAIRAIEDQENYIAYQDIYDNFKRMLDIKSDLSMAMVDSYGADGSAMVNVLNKWLDRIVGAEKRNRGDFDRLFSKLRGNLAVSSLAGNLSSILKQFPTVLLAASDTGMGELISASGYYMANRKEAIDFLNRYAKQMTNRMRLESESYHLSVDSPMFAGVRDIVSKNDPGNLFLRSKETFNKMVRFLMGIMQRVDTDVANTMWFAEYRNMLRKFEGDKARLNLSDQEFIQYIADKATQRTLSMISTSGAKDNSLAYSDRNPMLASMIQFTSQLAKQYGMIRGSANEIRKYGLNRETLTGMFRTLFYIGLATLATAFIGGKAFPDEDDEHWWDNILSSLLAESLSMIPLVGSDLSGMLTGEMYYDRGLIGDVSSFVSAVRKGDDRREGQLGRATMNLITGIGQVVGSPTSLIRRPYNAVTDPDIDINIGELINPDWGDFYGRFF